MKNKFLLGGLLLMLMAVAFVACEEEVIEPFENYASDGALPVPSNVSPNFFDFVDFDAATTSFDLAVKGDASVSSIDVMISYNGAPRALLTTINSFPGNVSVTGPEVAAAAGVPVDSVKLKDNFTFSFIMETSAGTLLPNTTVSIPVSCPSDLAGTYDVSTTYAQHDFLPDFPSNTMDMEVEQVADGIYSVSDFSGGLYSVGPYVTYYGTTGLPVEFQEICNEITWTNQSDPWQTLLIDPNGTNAVDPAAGTITITPLGEVYGENWTSVYTPK